jgi:hypothetical protein
MDNRIDERTAYAQDRMIANEDVIALGDTGETLTHRRFFDGSWGTHITLGLAYYAGIVEGKRLERARRKRT